MEKNTEISLRITGMTCAACVRHVEKALRKVEGVTDVSVNLATETATVQAELGISVPPLVIGLVAALDESGYGGSARSPSGTAAVDADEPLGSPIRGVLGAAVFTVPLLFPAFPPRFALLFATIVQFAFGARFYRASFRALRARTANMDLLVALGTTAAYGLSLYHLATESHFSHGLYFESSAVVITLVLLGKWLESRVKARTKDLLHAMAALRPRTARVLRDGVETENSIEGLAIGDVVIVRAGERVPVDGEVFEGTSQVDESLITGESLPVTKGNGDFLIEGSMNGEGELRARVRLLAHDSMLARMVRAVEDAQAQKAAVQKLVDRVSAVFVPLVLLIALITLCAWGLMKGDWSSAWLNAVSILVIACPCALGLATPVSLLVGTTVAAKYGILIGNAEALESARAVKVVAFDKTGTLTVGRPTVARRASVEKIAPVEVVRLVAGLLRGSEHPFGKAVRRFAQEAGIAPAEFETLHAEPGRGVRGSLGNRVLTFGSSRWMTEIEASVKELRAEADVEEKLGRAVSWLAAGDADGRNRVLGFLSFVDAIKPEAQDAVAELRRLGVRVTLLSGDHSRAAAEVAKALGIADFSANLLPEDKVRIIRDLRRKYGKVAMIGDGVNDSPALAEADIGIAMATGSDIAMRAANLTLLRGDPRLVAAALDISRRTYRKIRENLFWAFAYNAIGIPLAALGYLNPMLAGGAMALSSVSLITNALLLRNWRPKGIPSR